MPEEKKDILSLALKRPGDDSYSDLTDTLREGQCTVKRRSTTNAVTSANIELALRPDTDELRDEIEALRSGTDTFLVKLKMSVEGVDESVSGILARSTVTPRDDRLAFKLSAGGRDKVARMF